MSIRAYRINSTEKRPSFNIYYDEGLINFLEKNGARFYYDNSGDCVFIEVAPEILQKALDNRTMILDNDVAKKIYEDIEFSKKGCKRGDTLYYQCY